MTKNCGKLLRIILILALILCLGACSKDSSKDNGDKKEVAAALPSNNTGEKADPGEKSPGLEENSSENQEDSASEEPSGEANETEQQEENEGGSENEEWDLPTLNLTDYQDHEGVLFLQAFTELIKAERYSEAARFFTEDMTAEIRDYGYENPEKYLKDIFSDTAINDIELVLYEVNDEYIFSGIRRKDGTTPFSANLEEKKWVLNFSSLY